MNKAIFTGRTTKDIEIRYMQNDNQTAWGKIAESMEKYVPKGTKIIVECEARQNNYTDRNGNKVNTVDFTVLNFEFCESKNSSQQSERPQPMAQTDSDGFMQIPDGLGEEFPFS